MSHRILINLSLQFERKFSRRPLRRCFIVSFSHRRLHVCRFLHPVLALRNYQFQHIPIFICQYLKVNAALLTK